jgi:hypothetical protein
VIADLDTIDSVTVGNKSHARLTKVDTRSQLLGCTDEQFGSRNRIDSASGSVERGQGGRFSQVWFKPRDLVALYEKDIVSHCGEFVSDALSLIEICLPYDGAAPIDPQFRKLVLQPVILLNSVVPERRG